MPSVIRVVRAALVLSVLSLGRPGGVAAQSVPDLWVLRTDSSVVVQVRSVPVSANGFHVERRTASGVFERLTETPVTAVSSEVDASIRLGPLLPLLQDRTRSLTEAATIRLIRRRDAVADLIGWLAPEVAEVQGRRFVDSDAPSGEQLYRVVFVDYAGVEVGAAEGVASAETVPPEAPAAPSVDLGNREVSLEWSYAPYAGDPTDVVVGFHVYRGTADATDFARRTALPIARQDSVAVTWRDTDVRNGTVYSYLVRAVDVLGREGAPSEVILASPEDPTPPSIPEGLTTLAGEGTVTLLWRLAPESDLAGYRIERSTGLDQPWDTLVAALPANQLEWTDSTAVGGRQLFYRLVAIDGAGRESEPSNPSGEVALDTRPPQDPTGLEVTVEGRAALASWVAVDEPQLLGYHVYRTDQAGLLTRLTSRPTPDPSWRDGGPGDAGLVPGDRYTLRVTAVDSAGNESGGPDVTFEIPDDVAPGPPSSIAVRPGAGTTADVQWNAASGRDVELYVLRRSVAGASAVERVDTIPASRPRSLRTEPLRAGTTYTFRLTAVDSVGNEGPAATADYTAGDRTPPPAPAFVQARTESGGARVVWERVVARDLTGYVVQRAALPTGAFEDVSEVLATDTARSWIDAEGSAGLWYRVVAVDTSGNRSEASAPARAEGGR
jgi:predicted phage tail protein